MLDCITDPDLDCGRHASGVHVDLDEDNATPPLHGSRADQPADCAAARCAARVLSASLP